MNKYAKRLLLGSDILFILSIWAASSRHPNCRCSCFCPNLQNAGVLTHAFGASSDDTRLFKVGQPLVSVRPVKDRNTFCGFRVPLNAPASKTDTPRELFEPWKLSHLTVVSASFAAGVSLGTLWAGASRGTRKQQRFLSLPGRTDSTRIVKHWKDASPDAPKKHA